MAKNRIIKIKQTNKSTKIVINPFDTKGTSKNIQSGKIVVQKGN